MQRNLVDGVALGVFLTLLVVLLFALFFDMQMFGKNADSYIQTMLTSTVAAGAGYLALRGIRNQIQTNFELEDQRRRENLRAARAALPMALSEIVSTARQVLTAIFEGREPPPESLVRSILSPSVLDIIQKCIQYSDEQSGERLSQIIRYAQLVIAPYESGHFRGIIPVNENDWTKVGHSRVSYAIAWAVLDAISNSAFSFARGAQKQIPLRIDLPAVVSAFFSASLVLDNYPLVRQTLEARSQGDRLEIDFSRG